MARVVGLDIGRSNVRAVVLELNLRAYTLLEAVEEPITEPATGGSASGPVDPAGSDAGAEARPDDQQSNVEREEIPPEWEDTEPGAPQTTGLTVGQREAVARIAARGLMDVDAIFVALPSDDALLARVSLPFGSAREIEAVIAPQLEGRVPGEVEDFLIDFMRGDRAPSGEFVVYAAAVEPDRVASLLADLERTGVDPKGIDVPPFPLLGAAHALVETLPTGPVAVVDIGSDVTGVAIFAGDALQYARSFPGGGERVTDALAAMFSLEPDAAREGKHREGFIDLEIPASDAPSGDDGRDVAAACRSGAEAWARQLRRTLHAHATEWGAGVETIYLCGGGAQLPGLPELVTESLGVQATVIPANAPFAANVPEFQQLAPRFATALGLALRGTSVQGASSFNVRKGEFAYRGSHENLRRRLPQVAIGVVVLCVLGIAMALGRVAMLSAESEALDSALAELSEAVLGEAVTDPGDIQRQLRLGSVRPSFIPERSAYALFAEVSQTVGGTLDLGYDIRAQSVEVDLERRIFRVEGEADSAESVDTFQSELAARECFHSIERDDLSQRRDSEVFSFSVQGVIDCDGDPEGEDR